jgi:hypothetical protein
MPHPLVLALFADTTAAEGAARAVRALGIQARDLSIIARDHAEEGVIAREVGATPGVEIEDSRAVARLGELGAHILAAIAIVMPGIGPIISAGPLAAELGEVTGHAAGGLGTVLREAGLAATRAEEWERCIETGAVLLGVHVRTGDPRGVTESLASHRASEIVTTTWDRDA